MALANTQAGSVRPEKKVARRRARPCVADHQAGRLRFLLLVRASDRPSRIKLRGRFNCLFPVVMRGSCPLVLHARHALHGQRHLTTILVLSDQTEIPIKRHIYSLCHFHDAHPTCPSSVSCHRVFRIRPTARYSPHPSALPLASHVRFLGRVFNRDIAPIGHQPGFCQLDEDVVDTRVLAIRRHF